MVVCEGKNVVKLEFEFKWVLGDDDDNGDDGDGAVPSCGIKFDISNDKSIESDLPSIHLSPLLLPFSEGKSCSSYSSEPFGFKGWKLNSLRLDDSGSFLRNAAIGKINIKATKFVDVK